MRHILQRPSDSGVVFDGRIVAIRVRYREVDGPRETKRAFPEVTGRENERSTMLLDGECVLCRITDVESEHRLVELAGLIKISAAQKQIGRASCRERG